MPMSQTVAAVLGTLQKVPTPYEIFPSLDTPFSKYSRTNYTASEWEIPAIHQIISQRQNQIKDIDSIIESAEAIANQFREMREQLVSLIKVHEGFISCIRRLPPEILKEIFIKSLPQNEPVQPAAHTAPLLLTQICTGWRAVAHHTPRLWCSLSIKQSAPRQLSFYHDWLKKAQNCPLSFDVFVPSLLYEGHFRKATLRFLQNYTRQSVNLKIWFSEVDGLHLLLKDVPMLERLFLSGDTDTLVLEEAGPITIVQPYPRLHTLIIQSPTFDLSRFNPGWTTITRLAIVLEMGDEIFFTILQICPNLEEFVFYSVPDFDHLHTTPVSLTHSALHVLQIVSADGGGSFLDRLFFPNLRSLHVNRHLLQMDEPPRYKRGHDRVFNLEIECRVDLQQAVGLFTVFNPGWADLTHLKLDTTNSQDVFLHLLQLCPNLEDATVSSIEIYNLEYLEFSPIPITHPVLRSLSIRSPGAPIELLLGTLTLPSLCHISVLLDLWYRNWSQAGFKEFVARSQCPLESVKIHAAGISSEEREEFPLLIPTLRSLELCDVEEPLSNFTVGKLPSGIDETLVHLWTH